MAIQQLPSEGEIFEAQGRLYKRQGNYLLGVVGDQRGSTGQFVSIDPNQAAQQLGVQGFKSYNIGDIVDPLALQLGGGQASAATKAAVTAGQISLSQAKGGFDVGRATLSPSQGLAGAGIDTSKMGAVGQTTQAALGGTPTDIVQIRKGADTMQVMRSDVSYWQKQGWQPTTVGTSIQETQQQPGAPTDIVQIKRGSDTMQVMRSDVSYWQKQGWQPTEAGTTVSTGTLPSPPANSAFKNSSSYKALSKDLQDLVDLAFSTFVGTPEQQQIFSDALKKAQELADPYSKAQLALAFGEFQSRIAFEQGDLERASNFLESTRQQIQQEVALNKENLSLQQQAEIAKQIKGYNEDLLTIADQAAEKGLTFATGARSRVLAEERRGQQMQDVIQSTQRETNFRMNELSARAAQGDTKAAQQLADLKAKSSFNLETIGRAAERVLGSANVPGGTGYTLSGNVLGELEQERRKSIIDIASLGLPQ